MKCPESSCKSHADRHDLVGLASQFEILRKVGIV